MQNLTFHLNSFKQVQVKKKWEEGKENRLVDQKVNGERLQKVRKRCQVKVLIGPRFKIIKDQIPFYVL